MRGLQGLEGRLQGLKGLKELEGLEGRLQGKRFEEELQGGLNGDQKRCLRRGLSAGEKLKGFFRTFIVGVLQ